MYSNYFGNQDNYPWASPWPDEALNYNFNRGQMDINQYYGGNRGI